MGAHAYANEMLMRMDRFLEENLSFFILLKLHSIKRMCYKKNFFRLKL